jgi:hypothetical protein
MDFTVDLYDETFEGARAVRDSAYVGFTVTQQERHMPMSGEVEEMTGVTPVVDSRQIHPPGRRRTAKAQGSVTMTTY